MRIRNGALVAVVAVGWWLAAPPGADARRCKNDAACNTCFDATLVAAPPGLPDCTSTALDRISERQTRAENIQIRYDTCFTLVPGRPGTCFPLTFRALNRCRGARAVQFRQSWAQYRNQVRTPCGAPAVAAASKARRKCFRRKSCPCEAPPLPTTTSSTSTTTTTTTTTSTTTTSTSTTTTTTSTTIAGNTGSTTTTTTTSSTSTSTTTRQTTTTGPETPSGSPCQMACIKRVAKGCYNDCGASCNGDQEALTICRRACRDGQCNQLRQQCVPPDDPEFFDQSNPRGINKQYFNCCKTSDEGCDDDGDDTLACQPTTTVTTTSSSSSTVSSTTGTGITTTSIAGGTTTTTVAGAATTTTTLAGGG